MLASQRVAAREEMLLALRKGDKIDVKVNPEQLHMWGGWTSYELAVRTVSAFNHRNRRHLRVRKKAWDTITIERIA